jgi:uncharacterized protein with GYD domain
MATFLILGKYGPTGMKESAVQRKERVEDVVERCGGTLESMYPLPEADDYAFVVTFPGAEETLKAEAALSRTMGIAFSQ